MKQTYPVQGMHCASCAQIITTKVLKIPGVVTCEVNFATKNAVIDFDQSKVSAKDISDAVSQYGYSLVIDEKGSSKTVNKPHHENKELADSWKRVLISIPLVTITVGIMIRMIGMEYGWWVENEVILEFVHHLLPIFASVMLFVVWWKYVVAIGRYIRYGVANMDTLVGIGTVTAFLYSFLISAFEWPLSWYLQVDRWFYEAVIVVIWFIELGKYMEIKVMSKTGKAIKALLGLQAKNALMIKDGKEVQIALEQVQIGDVMIVKPWEQIPLDGVIVHWKASIDESMITGEPLPVSKKVDEIVIWSTIVINSTIQVKATAVGKDTYLSKIIAIVSDAQNSKPQIQKLVDQIMKRFVPWVLVIALCAWLFWLFLGNYFFPDINSIQFAFMSFVGVLVIACPCWLGLATPMAIVTGVGHGAKHGILAKNAEWILKLRLTKIIVFDKTGTITEGKPKLLEIKLMKSSVSDHLSILSWLESLSSHPIAHAIVAYGKEHDISPSEVSNFENLEGVGVQWEVDGINYIVCKPSYLDSLGITYDRSLIDQWTLQGKTPLVLTTKDEIVWYYVVADEIKVSSRDAIADLKKQNIIPVMLTGDHTNTAQYIAWLVGIDRVYAEVKPEEKAAIIKELQKEWMVTMVGDGINDAPALATADIGIAMSTGTDVAIESADLTLLHGDLSKLVKALKISKLTQSAIRQNLAWAFGFNLIGIPLAAGVFYPFLGILLNPAFEWAAMAFSDLTVVGNSLRLQAKKM